MNHLWKWLLAWAACALMLVVNAWPTLESAVDDAFISARYAAHGANGFGLVYNAGEVPIEGYSNLLWTLWLSLCIGLGLDLHSAMIYSGLVFGVLALGGLLACAYRVLEGHPAAVVPAVLLALSPHFAIVTTNGLESSQYMAVVLGTLALAWCVEGRWRWLVGILLGLLWSIRPEGLVIAVCIMGFDLWGRPLRNRTTWSLWGGAMVPWMLLIGWRLWVYGAWLPNTAAAKATGDFVHLLNRHWNYLRVDWWFWLVWLILAILGSGFRLKSSKTWLMWLMMLTSLGIAAQVYLWMPGARLLLLPMALGFVMIAQPLTGPRWMSGTWAVLLGVFVLFVAGSPLRSRIHRLDAIHSVVRDNPALQAARHLEKYAPPDAWLATRDAGVFAYGVGPGVRVGELHPRALTQVHPEGKDADPLVYLPPDPTFFVFTTNRQKRTAMYYHMERRIYRNSRAEYRYLGRVKQHHHRYYDIYVREDVDMPPLPEGLVLNHALVLPPKRRN